MGLVEEYETRLTRFALRITGDEETSLSALKKAYGAEPVTMYDGATIPVVSTFAHELGIPPFPVGFGRLDDSTHGPDEKFAVGDFEKAMGMIVALLAEVA